MSGIEIEHKQSSISSVRSTVSNASSGYAIITPSQPAARKAIPLFTPPEPPPDYDVDDHYHHHTEKLDRIEETIQPLLTPEDKTVTESLQQNKKQTIVRINSSTHDVRIEVSDTQMSPGSTSGDATFLYTSTRGPEPNNTRKKNKSKCTKRERCLCVSLVTVASVLLLTVVAIVLYLCVFNDS